MQRVKAEGRFEIFYLPLRKFITFMSIRKILVVDDSPTDRHVLRNILIENGYQVGIAESGEEGVSKIKESMPDLVLMDVVMPGMNGFQATRQITKGVDTSHIPVVIVPTKDQETDRVWGKRQGACDYLTKPVDESLLMKVIHNLIPGK